MHGKFEDFIGVWENIVPKPNCEDVIYKFNQMRDNCAQNPIDGQGQFSQGIAGRKDYSYNLFHLDEYVSDPENEAERSLPVIHQFIASCLDEYIQQYSAISHKKFYSHHSKVQHTPEGGGYHVWHDELGEMVDYADRVLVWMLYLNEDFEGGETEFLFQKRRIKPSTGTVVIWPAYFTHYHKGNLVLKGDKYVITGWWHQAYSH